jgi:hypothetical protein
MNTVRIWLIRVIIITLLAVAVIKSPTAFVAALLGVILAGYLIFIWIKWKFWRILSPLADMGNQMREVTLSLQKANPRFHKPERVQADIEIFKRNGFTILGTYTAKQIPATNIVLANNESEGIHALIMDMEHLGPITEYCSKYEDERTFTCSNTRIPEFMPRPDTHAVSRFPGLDAQEVLNRFKESRPASGIRKIKGDEIPQFVESLYRELKVYAIESITNASDLENQLLENFIVNSGWSAIEWHRKQNDVLIIHDQIKNYELISKYESAVDDEDEQYQKMKGRIESIIKGNTPLNAFKLLTSEIPTMNKLQKIHELSEPIPAHVYIKVSVARGSARSDF